jgi:hypothetical protein
MCSVLFLLVLRHTTHSKWASQNEQWRHRRQIGTRTRVLKSSRGFKERESEELISRLKCSFIFNGFSIFKLFNNNKERKKQLAVIHLRLITTKATAASALLPSLLRIMNRRDLSGFSWGNSGTMVRGFFSFSLSTHTQQECVYKYIFRSIL